jgi:hypothetical protein
MSTNVFGKLLAPRGRRSGLQQPFNVSIVLVWRIRNRKIVSFEPHIDTSEMPRAPFLGIPVNWRHTASRAIGCSWIQDGRLGQRTKNGMRQLFCRCPLLLTLAMELACLSAESCLWPPPVLAQEKKLTQTEKSAESADVAVTHATGAALQANAASAVKILLSVRASAFAGNDAEWRSCMIDRFGPSGTPPRSRDRRSLDREACRRLCRVLATLADKT